MATDKYGKIAMDTGEAFSHLYFDEGILHAIGAYAKYVKGKSVVFIIGHKSEGELIDEINNALGDVNGSPPIIKANTPQDAADILKTQLKFARTLYRTPNPAEFKLDSVKRAFGNNVVYESVAKLERFLTASGLLDFLTATRQISRRLALAA